MCTFHFPNLQNNPCLVYGAKKKFAKHVCFKFNLPYNKLKYSIPFQATFSGYTNTFFHWMNLVIQIFFFHGINLYDTVQYQKAATDH